MLRTAGFQYERSHVAWQDETLRNGRISYMLMPATGTVFGDVAEDATGSHSMLHEAREHILRLGLENERLRAQLAARP